MSYKEKYMKLLMVIMRHAQSITPEAMKDFVAALTDDDKK